MKDEKFPRLPEWWPVHQAELKSFCQDLLLAVSDLPDVAWEVEARPGVSHSLRAASPPGRRRPWWMVLDIVQPLVGDWWLSICFYADEITDPEERGEAIPDGLLDETGHCFSVEERDEVLLDYLEARLKEAHQRAWSKGGRGRPL